jgi:hypothetical protein
MYRPALKVSLKQPGQADSEVFLCEECDHPKALIKKYLLAHQQLCAQTSLQKDTPVREDDYCFQFGRAVHGTVEMMEESFMPDSEQE